MSKSHSHPRSEGPDMASVPEALTGSEAANVPAWEEIDTGRFKPRRIRGSFRGRELG